MFEIVARKKTTKTKTKKKAKLKLFKGAGKGVALWVLRKGTSILIATPGCKHSAAWLRDNCPNGGPHVCAFPPFVFKIMMLEGGGFEKFFS